MLWLAQIKEMKIQKQPPRFPENLCTRGNKHKLSEAQAKHVLLHHFHYVFNEESDFSYPKSDAVLIEMLMLVYFAQSYVPCVQVVDLVRRAMPLALAPEDDPRRDELKRLQEKKEEIDRLAHKQVRRILWSGLGLTMAQVGLFFRLTFWEFSWDVMEPIAFFTTTAGIIVGYAYFLITSNDPTYQDMVKRLFLSRQRKLFKKHNFDIDRFLELQKTCKSPLDVSAYVKSRRTELEDALHGN